MAANDNIPPVLGSLDFNEIKNNLIEYLRNQNIIKDYNYEGSVIRTLIDLLAYNTFYYAYYSNMIASEMFLDSAQRMESVISLVKPLGYTVAGRRSARTTINLTGLANVSNNIIPKHSIFYGINDDGRNYTFRNLDDVNIADSQCAVEIIEAKGLVYDTTAIQSLDVGTQKYFIPNSDIDLSTLQIEVKLQNETSYSVWRLSGNIGSSSDIDQKIYFVERTVNGFVVQFGIQNNLGISLTANDNLRIRYVTSSGSEANDIFVFRSAVIFGTGNFNLSIVDKATGGLNEPDLNTIKFLAPKWFSAQDRAVTKNDYIALIMESGYAQSLNDFAVFGGEEIYPPKYGRVFVSLSTTNQTIVTNLINFLREKSVITIFPEYVISASLDVTAKYAFNYNNGSASQNDKQRIINSVKSYIQTNYLIANSFNVTFNAQTVCDDVNAYFLDSGVVMNPEDFKLFSQKIINPTDGEIVLNLQNEIDVNIIDELQITTPFRTNENRTIILYLRTTYSTDRNRFVDLIAKDATSNTDLAGYFGKVQIKKGVIQIPAIAATAFTLTIPFLKKYFTSSNNNLVSIYQTGVEII